MGVGQRKCEKTIRLFMNYVFVSVFQYDPRPPKHTLDLMDYVKHILISLFVMVQEVKFRDCKYSSLVSVCFKCKIRFKTYGIHHNKNIDQPSSRKISWSLEMVNPIYPSSWHCTINRDHL